eukprot:1146063-Pelagomonas_calceolata.AAC.16
MEDLETLCSAPAVTYDIMNSTSRYVFHDSILSAWITQLGAPGISWVSFSREGAASTVALSGCRPQCIRSAALTGEYSDVTFHLVAHACRVYLTSHDAQAGESAQPDSVLNMSTIKEGQEAEAPQCHIIHDEDTAAQGSAAPLHSAHGMSGRSGSAASRFGNCTFICAQERPVPAGNQEERIVAVLAAVFANNQAAGGCVSAVKQCTSFASAQRGCFVQSNRSKEDTRIPGSAKLCWGKKRVHLNAL